MITEQQLKVAIDTVSKYLVQTRGTIDANRDPKGVIRECLLTDIQFYSEMSLKADGWPDEEKYITLCSKASMAFQCFDELTSKQ